MDDVTKIDDFIEYYYKKYKLPFRIQRFRCTPFKWINYKGKEDDDFREYKLNYGYPNHREPLPCEIVMDIDYHVKNVDKDKEKEAFKITLKAIKQKLTDLHLSYSLWKSGGNGYHFHLFFDELKEHAKFDRTELKHAIVKHIAYGFLTFHKDRAMVDTPVMITVENQFSRKGKKKVLKEQVDNGNNQIPLDILIKYKVNKDLSKYIKRPTHFSSNGEPNSIKFFLSNDCLNKDGKKRALFILTSWYAQQNNDADVIYHKLYEWNEYTLRGYLTERNIRSTVNSVLKSKSRVTSRYRNRLLTEIGAEEFKDD